MRRLNIEGFPIKKLTICVIGGSGFIGSHLCEKLVEDTIHKAIVVDVCEDKIYHLLGEDKPWSDRFEFHRMRINDSSIEPLIKESDVIINLGSISAPLGCSMKPLDLIYSNLMDVCPVVRYCCQHKKRLIHFSTSEVYGKTIASFLPKNHPLRQSIELFKVLPNSRHPDGVHPFPHLIFHVSTIGGTDLKFDCRNKVPAFFVLREDDSPCIFGPVKKQRWAYACAKQMIERMILAESSENGLQFTIVRPFNWIGPKMDYVPGIIGPSEAVPGVIAAFSENLLWRQQLKLVDGGLSRRTFLYIKDAVEAILLIIENPARANNQIFNVGNPRNEITMRQLADLMIKLHARISGEPPLQVPTVTVSSQEFYGEEGHDHKDRCTPDTSLILNQLGWRPRTPLFECLEPTLAYQHKAFSKATQGVLKEFSRDFFSGSTSHTR